MKIDLVEITNFRNLEHIKIELSHGINLFCGQNGSGKTSLLEAMHYLGVGRSFRTRHIPRLVHYEAASFSIFCQLFQPYDTRMPIGIERQKESAQSTIRVGGKPAASLIEVAKILPMQLIHADGHLLLTAGPLVRRRFLDWGVFHVEPNFLPVWQRASRLIKQRNAGLKNARCYQDVAVWDEELEICAIQIDRYRRNYIDQFAPIFQLMLESLLERSDFKMCYSPGWQDKQPMQESYRQSFNRDKQLGYTQQGPHRADFQLKIKNIAAQDVLSQGQQKLAAYALRLAQGKLLYTLTGKDCLFLIDDLLSELDSLKRSLVASLLSNVNGQLLITGIEAETLAEVFSATSIKRFHMERGAISGERG